MVLNETIIFIVGIFIGIIITVGFAYKSRITQFDGEISVYIDEDHDYRATVSFNDLKEAMSNEYAVFKINQIYLEG